MSLADSHPGALEVWGTQGRVTHAGMKTTLKTKLTSNIPPEDGGVPSPLPSPSPSPEREPEPTPPTLLPPPVPDPPEIDPAAALLRLAEVPCAITERALESTSPVEIVSGLVRMLPAHRRSATDVARASVFSNDLDRASTTGKPEAKGAVMDRDRVEGKVKETEGEAQQKWGEAKDKGRDAWKDVKDKAEDVVDDAEEKRDRLGERVGGSSR